MWAFRGLRRGVVPRAEASWLFTIAQNACRARHRARGRRRQREVLSDPQILEDLTAAPPVENEELLGLEDALARMPELQRRAILLREWRGMSYREIAAELELSGAAVETLIFRARRSLADLLAGRPAPKRARRFAFEFGSAGAALKAFGTGTAAKLAAGLAAAAVAVAIAGSTPQATLTPPERPSVARDVQPKRDVSSARTTPAAHPSVRERAKPAGTTKTNSKPPTAVPAPVEPAPGGGEGSSPGQTVDDAVDSLPLVSDVAATLPFDTATDVVDTTLGTATGAVDATLETGTAALPAPVVGTLP
jgi:hypothetical protein